MKVAATQGAGTSLLVTEMADPTPRNDEVVVRVDACGVCGSDLHIAQHLDIPGIVLGHEFCGTVVAIGTDCDPSWQTGERVAVFPLAGCGACDFCRAGYLSKCASAEQLGLQRPGGFAEFAAVPATSAYRLPESFDNAMGALVEPLAVAHHALDRTLRPLDEPILIIGGGPVGAAVALWARARGARAVVVSDPIEHRRDLALSLGATATIDPTSTDVAGEFSRLTGARPGVVVECVGNPGMIQHAADVAAVDAHVTVVGVCMVPDQMAPLAALQKELSMQYVLYYRRGDFDAAIRALHAGDFDARPMVTATVGFDAFAECFARLANPTTECKVLLTP